MEFSPGTPARILNRLTWAVLLAAAAWGQNSASAPPLQFEAADVHPTPKAVYSAQFVNGGDLYGTRFQISRATMVDLIANAWDIDDDDIVGGPSWLEDDRFDILAKAPEGTAPANAKLMLRALLEGRFHLVLHRDARPKPAFVLSLGQGKPKLKLADSSAAPGCKTQAQRKDSGASNNLVVCRGQTMDQLAQYLRDAGESYLTGPVLNKTGLEGAWDFNFEWTRRGQLRRAGPDAITLFRALDKQLGLKLEQQQIPEQVIVVDSVNRTPVEDPAGTAALLPAPPPDRFEVAVIKPTNPGFQGTQLDGSPNGQVTIAGATLSDMLQEIYFVTREMIAGAPKFIDTDRWDITAKAFTDPVAGNPRTTDTDTLIRMTRALLEDRFKLKVHFEQREVSGYVLRSAKPKLQKADPAERTGCNEPAPGAAGEKDPRFTKPVLSHYLICRNMTIAEFTGQLPYLASGYVHSPVLDATGLTGAYDFTLSFSSVRLVQNGGASGQSPLAPGAAATPKAADPNGAVSLADAISRQLGLKMEIAKHPAQVLVIDHIEQRPTEN